METFSHENQKSAGFSTYLAISSFGIGTLLFLLHFALPEYGLLYFIGYFYLILAFFINLLVFLNLLFLFFIKPNEREDLTIKMLIMLANIPIALLYLYIVFNKF
ncbi:hypothetical protein [Flavobacterium dankookense]|uniref:Uncharacterized protein n=1 Tax=Flavobacterium dankookense TaxID=706186 RepID=A0A4R6QBX9_9FLAO|nr:hypothetical protein [Flavobacterium dankookense]TDP59353.1 hypothetical protein BC748_1600 [Flavobacterium dankookense]